MRRGFGDAFRRCFGFGLLVARSRLASGAGDGSGSWVATPAPTMAPQAGRRPRVGIGIVTYNNAVDIGTCLASLRSNWADLAVRIEDNASTDGTADAARRCGPGTTVRANARNLGFAAAANHLAEDFDGSVDYLLLVNPDVVLAPDAIDQLVAARLASPQEAVIGGRMLRDDGSLDPTSCLAAPSLRQAIAFTLALRRWPFGRWLDPDELGGWSRSDIRSVPALTGALLLVDMASWRELGGFDEHFFLYGEDVDLSLRARTSGAAVLCTGLAQYTHRGGASSTGEAGRWPAILRGKTSLYDRHLGRAGWLARQLLVTGTGLRAAAETVRLASPGPWRAVWRQRAGWRNGWSEQAIGPRDR